MPRHRSNEAQIVRCLSLLIAMARAKRGVQLRPFAERRGWSWRASYRDVKTLRSAGVPIEHEHGWYRVTERWIPAGAIDVSPDEQLALSVARQLAPGLRDTSFGRALDTLWSKLATPSRQTSLPLGDEAALRVSTAAPIDLGPHRLTFDAIRDALRDRHALRIRYRRPGHEPTDRVIEPSFMHWDQDTQVLYLRAYCRERGDFRLFAVHRIASIAPLPELLARRPDPAWDPARAFRLWHRATSERVTVRFSPLVADEIRERRWHATQQLTEAADGGVVLELDVAAPEELERWLLGFGPDAEVLAPVALADQLRRRHAEAAARYRGTLRAVRPRSIRAAGWGWKAPVRTAG